MDRMPVGFYDALPESKYDGNCVGLTRNCVGCDFYRRMGDEERCYWGVAWKKIVEPRKFERCRSLSLRKSPRLEAFERLDEVKVEDDCDEAVGFWDKFVDKGMNLKIDNRKT